MRPLWHRLQIECLVSYAYTDEHQAQDKGGNNVANQYIPARKHSLTCRLDWGKEFSKVYTLNVSLNGRVLSGVKNVEYRDYYDISKGTVTVNYPAYTLWKLSVSQRFTRYVTLNLAVDNIFTAASFHQAAGEFVNDDDFAVLNDIVLIFNEQCVGAKCCIQVVQ